jgi:hypothetical protein
MYTGSIRLMSSALQFSHPPHENAASALSNVMNVCRVAMQFLGTALTIIGMLSQSLLTANAQKPTQSPAPLTGAQVTSDGLKVEVLKFHAYCDSSCLFEEPLFRNMTQVSIESEIKITNVSGDASKWVVPCDFRWHGVDREEDFGRPISGGSTAWQPIEAIGVDLSEAKGERRSGWFLCPSGTEGWWEPSLPFESNGQLVMRMETTLSDHTVDREHIFRLTYDGGYSIGIFIRSSPSRG